MDSLGNLRPLGGIGRTKQYTTSLPKDVFNRLIFCVNKLNSFELHVKDKHNMSHLSVGEYVFLIALEAAEEFDVKDAQRKFTKNVNYIDSYRQRLERWYKTNREKGPPSFSPERILWGYTLYEIELNFTMDKRSVDGLCDHFFANAKGEFEALIQWVILRKPLEEPY